MNLCNDSNGNSFGSGAGASFGSGTGEPGTLRTGNAIGWMFPGGSSGIQVMYNRM